MDHFTRLSRDIILTYILPRLDGETLITLSSVSSEFFNLIYKNNEDLWRNLCISTWPGLLSYGPIMLSEIISTTFPGGYRSLFSEAFPSIHHRNTPLPPPPPPSARFTYAIDLFLHGEREPLFTDIQYQHININTDTYPIHAPWWISTVGNDADFQLLASNMHLNFIPKACMGLA
ncbi:hypothetical protein TSUD_359120 [Trifolium subterraneum]|uniref:F-box domain-containing protein n=1 Tax=Trifolium subterraneum TaxID=3900 RepID=A0A2Z6NPW5_TRISU|nr:hypothetical protein TSUD_359120 [Trifolium subterraneum]